MIRILASILVYIGVLVSLVLIACRILHLIWNNVESYSILGIKWIGSYNSLEFSIVIWFFTLIGIFNVVGCTLTVVHLAFIAEIFAILFFWCLKFETGRMNTLNSRAKEVFFYFVLHTFIGYLVFLLGLLLNVKCLIILGIIINVW